MADFGSPATANYTAPDGLATLGNLMSLKQKQQGLQSQQLQMQGQQSQNQSLAANAAVDTQNAKEKMAGAQLLADPVGNGLTDENGTPSKGARAKIMAAMPTTGDKNYSDLLTAATNHVQFKSAALKLRGDVKSDIASRLAGVAADDRSGLPEIHDALDLAKSDYADTPAADDVNTIVRTSKQAIDASAKTGGVKGAKNTIMGISRGGLGNAGITGAGGVAAPSNVNVDQGNQIQPELQQPALSGGGMSPAGPPITKGIPSGYMQGPGGAIIRADQGGLSAPPVNTPKAPVGSGKVQPLQRPNLNDPAAQKNYNDQIAAAGEEYKGVSSAANDPQNGVQVSRYRNGQIMQLTKVAPTGPGKDIWNHIASQFPGKSGDAFQTIGHYLAQNSAAMAGKMGVPNTNMGQATAAAAAGNQTQNPQTIAEITRVNDALNTGFDLYNRGLAKVTNNGSDMSKVPAFKQAFGANVDVNALRYADATRRGDKEELEQLKTKLGDSGIDKLKQKLVTLKTLVTSGDLP